jgi:hypothetical protein
MKNAVEMGTSVMIHILSFVEISSGSQKFIGTDTHKDKHTDVQAER